ncbi:hypothetical protein E8E11_008469 [Didymella keratinophila]|nr:hypothetical protein E8E11_008469 [Didymella keratinophila]
MASSLRAHGRHVSTEDRYETQEEIFALDLLIDPVEELQRIDQLETIQELTRKNSLLQQVTVEYQRQWCCTIDLLDKAQEAVLVLQRTVEHFSAENEAAERAWLASWGIERSGTDLRTGNPGGWI